MLREEQKVGPEAIEEALRPNLKAASGYGTSIIYFPLTAEDTPHWWVNGLSSREGEGIFGRRAVRGESYGRLRSRYLLRKLNHNV